MMGWEGWEFLIWEAFLNSLWGCFGTIHIGKDILNQLPSSREAFCLSACVTIDDGRIEKITIESEWYKDPIVVDYVIVGVILTNCSEHIRGQR